MASDYNKSVTSRNSVNPANFSFNTGNIIGYPNKISSGSRSSSGGTTTNLTLNLDELLTDNLEEGVTSEKIADPKQYNTDDKKGFFESLGDMLTSVGATLAVGTTSVLSGVLDIVEGIGDGVVWVASKAVGIVSPDAEEAMKEFIARDLVSEANEWLYEDTEFGRAINDASYMKYDSELAQGIRDVTEDVAVFAAATALTVFTGGAAAPLTIGLGAAYGLGEASESTYATYGTDTSTFQELLILGNGALSALSWYTSGKLGKGFIELGKSMAEAGVKEILAEMCKGIFSKDMLKELLKPGNLVGNAIASLMQAGGDIGLIATKLYNGGEVTPEEWALLVGELILYFGLNTAEDVLSDTIISYGNPKIDVDMNKTPGVDDTKPIEILDETGLDTNPTKASDTNANPTENSPELTWDEYFKQKYGDGVEHTSGTGVDGHNGSFVDPDAAAINQSLDLEYQKWVDGIQAKGGSYDNLDNILAENGMTIDEYLSLSRTPQHHLSDAERAAVYRIRMALTSDVTDSAGVVLEGTRISKSIDADAFSSFYKDGDTATLGGCVALQRDTDALTDATDIVDSTGLRFDGSKFVDESGNPQTFYIVDGELMPEQPDLVVRVSATTDGVEISPAVAEQFELKHPDYKYNGYSISDNSSGNNTYVNEIWNRNRDRQVGDLAEHSGIARENIVTEEARWYNRTNNPDTGTGITLNQGQNGTQQFGIPEFYAKNGRVGIANGNIYRVEGNTRVLVGTIDEFGLIELIH